ncbi:hypothetical protein O3P69_020543 [Scylla paramamosain]|uniref:Uncharacterized protein n=1 Tax=Scylla paramamosain TaxID=85552 RepID=A0AAW0TMX6_SCYPA
MAGRPRFNTTTSRAPRTPRTPGVPSSHLATTLEMQQALMAMQQALARRSPASRVPTSATPEKWSFTREVAGAELDASLPDVAQEVVAGAHRHPAPASVRTRPPANRPHTPVEKPCGNCGGTHAPGRVHCPARSLNCYKCGKPGHVEKMCRSGGRRSTTPGLEAAVSVPQLTSGAVLVAGTAPCPHPTLHVSVTSGGRATCEVMAVADTGAQVAAGASQAPPARQPGLTEAPTRPAAIPLPPLEENVGRLEEWLLRHFSSSTFNVGRCPLPVMAEYPFQCTVTDLFQLEGNTYLVYADRLTGWLEIGHLPSSASSSKLMAHFRRFFARWGAPEEVSTDGGTNLVSEEMQDFFRRWGVRVRVSSAHYPQSNGRAEAAVKSAKRMLRLNIGPTGSLDTDKLSAALLQYHNTPLRGADSSPAQLATGRHLRDGVPTARCNYKVDQHWRRALRRRELAMARSGDERVERQGPVRTLEPLSPGSRVWVQNQMTKVWDRSGVVAEALPHRQYTVRLDGSGRLSLRNRRHLRVKRGQPSPAPAPSHAGPTPATSPTPQPRQSTPSRPRRTSRRPQWLADYDESSPP